MGDIISANAAGLTAQDGVATIEQGAALTRLHYFDGKFLRADALTLEQDYHRRLVRLSNLAGGWGVVHGLGVDVSGAMLDVSPGLAITPAGSTVLLTQSIAVEIAKLIAAATPAPATAPAKDLAGKGSFGACATPAAAGGTESAGSDYYEVTVGPIEALCGNEEVYGKLCEDACVTDSQRPYWREGLMLRLRPISLALPDSASVTLGAVHLRNRVASAYFAYEPWLTKSLLSAAGLACGVWCNPAALYTRDEVPIGILAREGGTTRFVDAWSARRERMDTQARGYWQGRMMMRPWNVFLAQILQFQCQLSGVFKPGSKVFNPVDDECLRLRTLLADSVREIELTRQKYADGNRKILDLLGQRDLKVNADAVNAIDAPYKEFQQLARKLTDAQQSLTPYTPNRLLLNGGFVELPSAGYLPVVPGKTAINDQVQRMFGEGVVLHFCTCRPDYIAHAVEEAQHMQRILLTRGLDDPASKEDVEIYVPDGEIIDALGAQDGAQWFVTMDFDAPTAFVRSLSATPLAPPADSGAAKAELVESALRARLKAAAAQTTTRTLFNLDMTGVARSAPLDAGGGAITLVCQPADDLSFSQVRDPIRTRPPIQEPEPKPTEKVATTAAGAEAVAVAAADVATGAATSTSSRLALYLDLRITEDPFARQEGDEVPLSLELREVTTEDTGGNQTATTTVGHTASGDGKLTIESISEVDTGVMGANGTVRINLLVDSIASSAGSAVTSNSMTELLVIPVFLRREGNARTGRLLIAPASVAALAYTTRTAVWEAQWAGTPRDAVFGIRGQLGSDAASSAREQLTRAQIISNFGGVDALPSAADGLIHAAVSNTIVPLVKLHEADAPLPPESAVRLAALNTLALIADATDDDAFLSRARRRLFPDTTASIDSIRVRAALDWIMFRRQRKAHCDLACRAVAPVDTDAFQTWHLKLDDPKQLEALKQALDQNAAAGLKQFNFQRVNVLHYGDAALTPAETTFHIVGEWSDAKPGRQLLLGRVWERTPRSGQGWQNNGRTKRLVQILASLIDPPASGVIHTLATAPSTLADPQFDGGILLVTAAAAPAQLTHRVFFVREQDMAAIEHAFEKDSTTLRATLENLKQPTAFVHFDRASGSAVKDDLAQLISAHKAMGTPQLHAAIGFVNEGSLDLGQATRECAAITDSLETKLETVLPAKQDHFGVDAAGNQAFAATVVPFVGEVKSPEKEVPKAGPAEAPALRKTPTGTGRRKPK